MTRAVLRLFDWKIRGVRWVEIIGVILVGAMLFSVYMAKAGAARVSGEIGDLERRIAGNGERVRLLRAEVAKLEQPARLEALSRQAGLTPLDARRLADEAALTQLRARPAPVPVPAEVQDPVPAAISPVETQDTPPAPTAGEAPQ
ncbi:cell division protein [Rhizobium sp. CRIBSB]|nr:cell division protein [Rhizobium sp. CRIBSB]